MTQCLISFDDGWMTPHAEERPTMAEAAQQLVRDARITVACRCPQKVWELLPDPTAE